MCYWKKGKDFKSIPSLATQKSGKKRLNNGGKKLLLLMLFN